MPGVALAPLLPSIITGVGSIAGAALGSRAANKATSAQSQANTQALDYAKQQEQQRRADYERALSEWESGRNALLQRYGVSVPALSTPRPPMMATGTPAAAPATGGGFGENIAAILEAKARQSQGPGQTAEVQSSPYYKWNDWEKYGLRQA